MIKTLVSRALALSAAVACLIPATATAADRSSFLLGVLPDTQFYSRYSTAGSGEQYMNRFGTEPYAEQTKWLVQNKTDLKIPFVTHLGDIVDRVNQPQEWQVADEAMKTLEQGGLPYSILAGNHDVGGPSAQPFLQWFPPSRAAAQPTFGGRDATGMHEWHKFTAEGRTFLVLAFSWDPTDADIAWAKGVLAANPTLPAIVTTHDILAIHSDAVTAVETGAGLRLWDKLIKDNDQIFLTINGHNHGSAHLRKTNSFGHSVDQIVWDYQMAYQGGNGYLGLLEFDFTNKRIKSAVVSPWIRLKPANTIVPEYDIAVKTGPNENLTLPIDWDARFAGFQTAPAPVAPSNDDLIAAAKAKVLEGYEEPEVTLPSLPLNESDYPEVPGTVAHWRFDASKPAPSSPERSARPTSPPAPTCAAPRSPGPRSSATLDLHRPPRPVVERCERLLQQHRGPCQLHEHRDGRRDQRQRVPERLHARDVHQDRPGLERDDERVDGRAEPRGHPPRGRQRAQSGLQLRRADVRAGHLEPARGPVERAGHLDQRQRLPRAHELVGRDHGRTAGCTSRRSTTRWPGRRRSTSTARRCCATRSTRSASATANKPWRIGATGGNGWLGCVGETRIVDHATSPGPVADRAPLLPGGRGGHGRRRGAGDAVADDGRSGLASARSCRAWRASTRPRPRPR